MPKLWQELFPILAQWEATRGRRFIVLLDLQAKNHSSPIQLAANAILTYRKHMHFQAINMNNQSFEYISSPKQAIFLTKNQMEAWEPGLIERLRPILTSCAMNVDFPALGNLTCNNRGSTRQSRPQAERVKIIDSISNVMYIASHVHPLQNWVQVQIEVGHIAVLLQTQDAPHPFFIYKPDQGWSEHGARIAVYKSIKSWALIIKYICM